MNFSGNDMTHSAASVLQSTLSQKIIPLASVGNFQALKSTVKALFDGGSKIFELTLRNNDVVALMGDYIKFSRQEFPSMAAGLGSISDSELANEAVKIKPDFIVSPGYSDAIRQICQSAGVLYVPGCQTATEITTLIEHKLPLGKLFPGGMLGLSNAKALLAPFARYRNQTKIMITGGVNIDTPGSSIAEWLDVVDAVGVGSIIGELADQGKFEQIQRNMHEALSRVPK